MSLTGEYLKFFEEYYQKYGIKTILLMQVGSFYECYSTNERGPDLQFLSQLLNIVLTRKDKSVQIIDEKNPKMMGFPCVSLQKNLKLMIDNGYTVILMDQTNGYKNTIKREVTGIFSPSTYIEEIASENQYLLTIYISEEKQMKGKPLYCIGITGIDLNIGKVVVDEYHSTILDEDYPFIKLKEIMNGLSPKEVLIYTEKSLKEIIEDKLDLIKYNVRWLSEVDKEIYKVCYQEKFLQKIFGDISIINIFEFLDLEFKPYSRVSLVISLDFCYKQNEMILKNLSKPYTLDKDKIFLGNNTIHNLNLLQSDNNKRYNSVFEVIDNTSTILGKRLLKERLLNPEINPEIIKSRYSQTENYLKENKYLEIQKILKNIKDIERFSRRITIRVLHPFELYNLYHSMMYTKDLCTYITDNTQIGKIEEFLDYISTKFNLEILEKTNMKDLENFYLPSVHKEIDEITNKINLGEDLVELLIKTLNGIVKEDLKFTIRNNKKEGQFLILTKKKGDKLETILSGWEDIEITEDVKIKKNSLAFSHTKTNTKIKIPKLGKTHLDANTLQNMIVNKIKKIYLQDLDEICSLYLPTFNYCIKIISELDCIISNCITAKKYNYCKPEIYESDVSFIEFKNLRHPIIERIIDYEYVPQSLTLGKDQKGVLLYGLNSSGKSSFQKSIGISIILAQAGLYVPAESFSYSPYKYLFTRIDGNDNLFKGLSSFTLEMMDLKNILRYKGKNSLIIGDEVCKGTEYLSANSILASTIYTLSNGMSTFIFATHLHEIPKLEIIRGLENVKCYHLKVELDKETNTLIYERTLQEGQGEEVYGILVAGNIIQDSTFFETVNTIKNILTNTPNTILNTKTSRYNRKVYIDECEICKKRISDGEYDVHHINFQKDCEDGFVKDKPHIPKNGKMNLLVLCEECHHKIHSNEIKVSGKKQTTKGSKCKTIHL